MAGPEAITRARVDNGRLRGDLRKTRGMFSKAFGKVGRGIKKTLGGALSPLGIGVGAFGLAAIGKEVLGFEQNLADLQIQAELGTGPMVELRKKIDELSAANGQSRQSLSAASKALVDLQGAPGASADKLEVLSKAALATGTPVEELAGLIFSLENAFKLTDPSDLQAGLDAIITAGKKGAIPLNEMNQILQSAGVTFGRFSATGVEGAADLAASLQILRRGFGDASQAGTGLESLMGILETRTVELAKEGIKVKDFAGDFKPLLQIVKEIAESGILADDQAFNRAFGKRKEARKALLLLAETTEEVKDLSKAALGSDAINRDVAKRRETDAFRIKKAFNDMKEAISKAFTPERIKRFATIMESVADVLEFMIDHAEIFIALWATFKIASLVTGFASIATSLSGAAVSAGKLPGPLGKAGSLIGSFAFGVAFGTQLDKFFGISDKIGNLAIGTKEEAEIESGFLRDRAKDFDFASRAQQALRGGELTRKQQLSGTSLLSTAREQGLIKDGQINRSKVFQKAEAGAGGVTGIAARAGGEAFLDTDKTRALLGALERALALEKAGKLDKVDIVVRVDPKSGKISAEETSESKSRRSTQ